MGAMDPSARRGAGSARAVRLTSCRRSKKRREDGLNADFNHDFVIDPPAWCGRNRCGADPVTGARDDATGEAAWRWAVKRRADAA